MEDRLRKDRNISAKTRPIEEYIGDYWNPSDNFRITVSVGDDGLQFCFQGEKNDIYPLSTYDNDVFSWVLGYDDQAKRGRWPSSEIDMYLFRFQADESSGVDSLLWQLDPSVGKVMFKREIARGTPHLLTTT